MVNHLNFHSSRVIAMIKKKKVDYQWTEIKHLTFTQRLNIKLHPNAFMLSLPCHSLIAFVARILKLLTHVSFCSVLTQGDGRK